MSTPHYDIVIATPGRMMHAEYVRCLVETVSHFSEMGYTVKYLNKYSSFIPTAREITAADTWTHDYTSNALGSEKFTYDKVIWIDSDIEWTIEDFEKLFHSEKEIISGLYVLDTAGTVAVHMPNDHGTPTRVNKVEFLLHDQPVEVGGVGFGFVCMKSGVFEKIERPWFLIGRVQWSPESEMRVNVGEDYSWCGRAQQAGFRIFVDPTVKVRHHKETVYEV